MSHELRGNPLPDCKLDVLQHKYTYGYTAVAQWRYLFKEHIYTNHTLNERAMQYV